MDSNASRAGEVERKVWWDNDFLLPGKLLRMSPLVPASKQRQQTGETGRSDHSRERMNTIAKSEAIDYA